jgi:hypothetical protein
MKGFMRTRISLPSAIRTHVRPFSLLAPIFLLLTIPIIARAQAPNPVAYLTFDEGAGTVAHDSSGNNNDATLLGGAGWTTGLVGSGALNLTGAAGSYADIPRDGCRYNEKFHCRCLGEAQQLRGLSNLR